MTERSGAAPASIDVAYPAPGVIVMRVRGSVDLRTVRRLRDELGRLIDPAGRPVRALEIDLSEVGSCDVRVLVVLDDARQRLHLARARFAVRGLDPGVLTSWPDARLCELFALYRASRDIVGAGWPNETGGRARGPAFGPADGRLAQACLDLATARRTPTGAVDVAAVTRHLVDLCVSWFGVDAAVVLVRRPPGRWAVGAGSTASARRLVVAGLGADQGPVAECLHHGGPVSVPDVSEPAQRWPRYADIALQHGVRAVRALPLRPPSRSGHPLPVGVLALFTPTGGSWAAADLVVAQTFADLAAVALRAGGAAPGPRHDDRPAGVAASTTEDQVLVEQAVGVIREREGVGAVAARDLLDRCARSRDLHLGEAARAVVTGDVDPGMLIAPVAVSTVDRTPP